MLENAEGCSLINQVGCCHQEEDSFVFVVTVLIVVVVVVVVAVVVVIAVIVVVIAVVIGVVRHVFPPPIPFI